MNDSYLVALKRMLEEIEEEERWKPLEEIVKKLRKAELKKKDKGNKLKT